MFTEGEWKPTKWLQGRGFNVFSEEGGFVASVPMNVGLEHTIMEAAANANLIASSPRMASLLQKLVDDGWSASISEEARDTLREGYGGMVNA
ncbi:hypothetical protein LCGC14_0488620 [marine sediment metagenome]|uniref:Uncharacterized protein n=1 Tax=marine sediment metagenome TaxID=412755 RepID=A0A0F9S746_9ZZZZ